MKILLTGGSGQLGKSIINSKPDEIDLIIPTREELNLEDPKSCERIIYKHKPNFVINSGAYTQVDNAEKNKDLSLSINAKAPKIFSEILRNEGGRILQISTDFVFNGNQGTPYKINQSRSPINHYGYTKSIGEEAIEEILGDTNQGIILRTSWLISPFGNNFVRKIINLLNSKQKISVVSDQIGCPTNTTSLSAACWSIIHNWDVIKNQNSKLKEILHWSDQGVASWYDIAMAIEEIGKELGLVKRNALVNPIQSNDYVTLAKRPSFSLLDTYSTRKILKIKGNHWRISLRNILKSLKS